MSYDELMNAYKNLQIDYDNLVLENNSLKRMLFGPKKEWTPEEESDKVLPEQCSLFETDEEIEKNVQEQIAEEIEEIVVHRKKNAKKKKAGLKRSILKDVVIKRNEYIINEGDHCPECDADLKLVGKKVVRQDIGFTPATLYINEYIQNIYKCEKCGTEESEKETSTFVQTNIPNALIPHSFASASLATEVIYNKYYLGVPLYRQEKMWDDKGLVLPRNMMANWCIKINEYYLEYLWKLMLKKLKAESELLHCDETKIQCNKEPGRKANSNSYMWVLRSGELEENKGVVFKYSPSRSAQVANEFLSGYKGILVTDGYACYDTIEGITHAECWSHARRYFFDSVPLLPDKKMNTSTDSYKGLLYCNKLFEIEEEIASLSVPEKQEKRQEKSKPVLEEFFNWVHDTLKNKTIVNNKLNKALTYASNQQKELSEFLNDGRIPIDNNRRRTCYSSICST